MTGPTTEVVSDDQNLATPSHLKRNTPAPINSNTETPIALKRTWFFGRTIAFVINDYSIEMAVVSSYLNRTKLIDTQKVYLPSDFEENERWTFIFDSVAWYLKKFSSKHTRVSVGLSGLESSYRTFLMPKLNSKQLASAIIFEIKKQLPFPIAECNYDYHPIALVPRGDVIHMKISMAAATKSHVERFIAPIEKAGCNLAKVYNAQEAVGQLLKYLPEFDPQDNYGTICVEPDQTLISFYRGSDLLFYNTTSIGSSIISSRTDSEKYDDFAQLLAVEVQNSLDYYAGQLSSNFSNKLLIHGDMAYTDELITQMKSHLGFDFCRFPTEELVFLSDKQKSDIMSIGVSLHALGAAVCNHKISNLLPPDRIEYNLIKTTNRISIIGLSFLVLILMSIWVSMVGYNTAAETNLGEINKTLEQFATSEIAIDLNRVKSELAAEQAYVRNSNEQNAYIGLNLKELSLLTPETIKLQMIEIDRRSDIDKGWRLVGTVRTSKKPHEIILADYVEVLKLSLFFSSVTLERYHKKVDGDSFELEFELLARSVL